MSKSDKFKNLTIHWWDIILAGLAEIIYLLAWLPQTNISGKDLTVEEEFWKTLVPVSQNSFVGSIIAVSILLPSTIGIMYYTLQNEEREKPYIKNAIDFFSYASFAFLLSIICAVIELAFIPMKLEFKQNITLDWVIAFFAITHFILFFFAVVRLFRGSRYLFKEYRQ